MNPDLRSLLYIISPVKPDIRNVISGLSVSVIRSAYLLQYPIVRAFQDDYPNIGYSTDGNIKDTNIMQNLIVSDLG